ncbi:hypothetical protein BDY17DRAFT_149912 [Neohortaea acidophila]|uniref:Uncharacterized protein n=1 Tax=Neohortaea acidophila TaxID=245834 RepID=A0A6A6PTX0_9PEZI|nr:uncharacterized protein BDY17DRAFT_149912 [Neohortaea acidophila]KAF2483548.1 hypothetical protein BDY17DRAFT_149912 [Neohortaea acidophila]
MRLWGETRLWRAAAAVGLCIVNALFLFWFLRKQPDHLVAFQTVPYSPYPRYNSASWLRRWRGEHVSCEGPRGKLLNQSAHDWVRARIVSPDSYPQPLLGDSEVFGVQDGVCFDSYDRLAPYGFEPEETDKPAVDWDSVPWAELQERCIDQNRERFHPEARASKTARMPAQSTAIPADSMQSPLQRTPSKTSAKYHHRTALLLRTWTGYKYRPNDLHTIRALITELSLLSGGEYEVFLLVNVKEHSKFWKQPEEYQRLLDEHVPREFHNISLLWSELPLLRNWYPEVGDWQNYWHQFMVLQWFSKTHPEFDYIWNWEMDARFIGNPYHLFEQAARYAKAAPRKYLWERNARFYVPGAHGNFQEWLNDTHTTIETAARDGKLEPVWGPLPYNASLQSPIGPAPPRSLEEDNFTWGVGEEADLITLLPMWDPVHTAWTYRDKIWNFLPGIRPHFSQADTIARYFHHAEFAKIPRRTFINTVARFSRRQLHAMHLENVAGRTMQAEMWPATVALHHGLKAVYAPHPIWGDANYDVHAVDDVFNANDNKPARWSSQRDSVYNRDREGYFGPFTWFYNARYPRELYRRWLGYESIKGTQDDGERWPMGERNTLCLPAMLLHPVKHVEGEDEE